MRASRRATHINVNTDNFCRDLARIAAKHLRQIKPEHRPSQWQRLQEATSLYSPFTADIINERLRRPIGPRRGGIRRASTA